MHPLVLAPDTCFTDSPEASVEAKRREKNANVINAKNSSFRKPLQNVSIANYFSKKVKRENPRPDEPSNAFFAGKSDLDETRMDKRSCLGDDEQFSIPASPILSGKFFSSKKQEAHVDLEQVEDNEASPTLLKFNNLKVSLLSKFFKGSAFAVTFIYKYTQLSLQKAFFQISCF